MKTTAYLLIALSFLAGAYYSVVDTERVSWNVVVPSLLIGLIGVALIQIGTRRLRQAAATVRSSIDKLDASLERIVGNVDRLDSEKVSIDVYEIHRRIDALFMDDLDVFVTHRESIGHAFGLQAYADVMTHFATGERYLNRCWSASTDGYENEVHNYLTRARGQFDRALELLRGLAERGKA